MRKRLPWPFSSQDEDESCSRPGSIGSKLDVSVGYLIFGSYSACWLRRSLVKSIVRKNGCDLISSTFRPIRSSSFLHSRSMMSIASGVRCASTGMRNVCRQFITYAKGKMSRSAFTCATWLRFSTSALRSVFIAYRWLVVSIFFTSVTSPNAPTPIVLIFANIDLSILARFSRIFRISIFVSSGRSSLDISLSSCLMRKLRCEYDFSTFSMCCSMKNLFFRSGIGDWCLILRGLSSPPPPPPLPPAQPPAAPPAALPPPLLLAPLVEAFPTPLATLLPASAPPPPPPELVRPPLAEVGVVAGDDSAVLLPLGVP
uniref:Uncharacterized protein n=1 Tax=Anopheles merus TaxID=30066 RepID=A0A182V480_ANOME